METTEVVETTVLETGSTSSWMDKFYANTLKFARYKADRASWIPEPQTDPGEWMYLALAFIAEVDEVCTAFRDYNESVLEGFNSHKWMFTSPQFLFGSDETKAIKLWIEEHKESAENVILEMGDVLWQAVHLIYHLDRVSGGVDNTAKLILDGVAFDNRLVECNSSVEKNDFGVKLWKHIITKEWDEQLAKYATLMKTGGDGITNKKALADGSLILALQSLTRENGLVVDDLTKGMVGCGLLRTIAGFPAKSWLKANKPVKSVDTHMVLQQCTLSSSEIFTVLGGITSVFLRTLKIMRMIDMLFVNGKENGIEEIFLPYFDPKPRELVLQVVNDPNAVMEANIRKLEGRYKPTH